MAFCRFSDTFALFDCTPVENLFIQEYMLRAPGDCVKVYLYGLMQCYHPTQNMSIEVMAKDLGMEVDVVRRAFEYWERERLVTCVGDNPRTYAYANLKQMQLTVSDPTNDLYTYKEFNQVLERLFEKKRKLYEQDYRRIYDWIEILALPQEVVLQLIGFMIDAYGVRFSFDAADKVAQEWAGAGVRTLEEAEEMTRSSKELRRGLLRVLRKLGQRRNPSQVEEEYYEKWTQRWGMSVEAILEACNETIKGTNPSMGYLDAILMRQWQQGNVSKVDMEKSREREREQADRVGTVLAALGRYGKPTQEDVRTVESWLEMGFEHAVIVRAAAGVHAKGSTSMEAVEHRLAQWHELGLHTGEALEMYLDEVRMDNRALAPVFAACSIDRRIVRADREMLRRWRDEWKLPEKLWVLAAQYARGSRSPMQVIDKILSDWFAKGIRDEAAARSEHAAHTGDVRTMPAASGTRPVREVAQHRYGQRTYTKEEDDALFTDLFGDDEAEGGEQA